MKWFIAALLTTLCLVSLLHAAKDAPDTFQIEADWRELIKRHPGCNHCWSTSRVAVVGKRLVPDKPDQLDVEIEVHGSMTASLGVSCREGPCVNVRKEGVGLKMRQILHYNRFGDKWILDKFTVGGVQY